MEMKRAEILFGKYILKNFIYQKLLSGFSKNKSNLFFFFNLFIKIRVPRMKVSSVFGGKLKGSDFSNESRVQVRSNGNNCVSRDTKDSSNEEQQDSGCPFNRQHIIRSNYMGKSIEAKKKVSKIK